MATDCYGGSNRLAYTALSLGGNLNTADFLAHVLPTQGFYFAVKRPAKKEYLVHTAADNYQDLTAEIQAADNSHATVWFACSSFQEPVVERTLRSGEIKKEWRTGTNAAFVKSVWLDLDCGPGKHKQGKQKEHGYPSQAEAIKDIVALCEWAELPKPLFVNSGNGVHCYWAFTKDLTKEQWLGVVGYWRAVVDHFGIAHDTKCTTDICRVLRPVGTHNRKHDQAKEVKVVGAIPEHIDPRWFIQKLATLVKENSLTTKRVSIKTKEIATGLLALNADFELHREFPPSDAVVISDHCQQVQEFRESGGNVSEPFWWAMIGLIKHTTDGEAVCHEWSQGHEGYSFEETQNKIEMWGYGPSTCEKFESLNPTSCEGCPFRGKIKSPIQLGGFVEDTEPVEEEDVDTGEVEAFTEFPEGMRDRYAWVREQLVVYTKDEEGVKRAMPMCDFLFYPKTFHSMLAPSGEQETHSTWVVRMKEGEFKQFVLSGAAAGVGGRELFSVLGKHAIFAKAGAKKHMEQYVSEWFSELRRMGDEARAFHTFGWHGDDFLIGPDLIKPDGSVDRVRLHGDAAKYAQALENHGSDAQWISAVDAIYNRPNHESYQWLLAGGFGAPLMKLMGSGMAGCVVNSYSKDTGLGKSTAGKLALAMYGDPEKLTRTQQQTTTKGLFIFCGIMNSLPVLLDEVTNIKPNELSDLVYTFSQGSGRLGAFSDGSLRSNVYEWSTTMLATSNKAFHNTLAVNKADARPEIARVFETDFVKPANTMNPIEAGKIIAASLEKYGSVGRTYMRYVVANRESVRDLLFKTKDMLTSRSKSGQDERYWMASLSTNIAGLLIAKRLGLIAFDIPNLVNWAIRHLENQRQLLRDTNLSAAEHLGNMLNEFAPSFLVTNIDGDSRSEGSRAVVIHAPRGNDLKGRVVNSTGMLYIPVAHVRKWCSDRQVDYKDMIDTLTKHELGGTEPNPISLGRGTVDYATAPSRCIRFDLNALGSQLGQVEAIVKLALVK